SLPGCGPAGFATIKAALELSQRYVYATLKRDGPLQTPSDAGTYLISRMKAYRREVFACLFLDTRHRVIAFRELFFGSVDSAQVHPREIIRACLEFNCAAVILAHNHPSGVAEPSAADRAITQRIVEAAGMVDVRVLDHLIVGECDVISMAELGLL
ncbi:MAG: DNA repair protein RadC, partial [Gammaproteobacteria bacterium]|nr:DNA repair protein RadC [Gammaproteobacteria bacterium]